MRLLLDTHILLWTLLTPGRLPSAARDALADDANDTVVSVASVWEIAIKHALGRLNVPVDRLDELIAELGCTLLPITLPHAIAAGALPRLHNDPFDRMLIAQARHEALTLVTADVTLRRYDVAILSAARI